jgi:hypothetical protein
MIPLSGRQLAKELEYDLQVNAQQKRQRSRQANKAYPSHHHHHYHHHLRSGADEAQSPVLSPISAGSSPPTTPGRRSSMIAVTPGKGACITRVVSHYNSFIFCSPGSNPSTPIKIPRLRRQSSAATTTPGHDVSSMEKENEEKVCVSFFLSLQVFLRCFFFPMTMVVGSDFESCICSCKMVCYSRKGDGWKYATCGSVDPEVLLTTTDPAPKRRQTRVASAASKAKPKRQKS